MSNTRIQNWTFVAIASSVLLFAVSCGEKPVASSASNLNQQLQSNDSKSAIAGLAGSTVERHNDSKEGIGNTFDSKLAGAATNVRSPESAIKTLRDNSAEAESESGPEETRIDQSKVSLLKVQIVQARTEGDLDIYITNQTGKQVTNCRMILFDELEMDVSPMMEPGQVAMCGIGGEIPEFILFCSDQFKDFKFELPETPMEEIDMSKFEWAEFPDHEKTNVTEDVDSVSELEENDRASKP